MRQTKNFLPGPGLARPRTAMASSHRPARSRASLGSPVGTTTAKRTRGHRACAARASEPGSQRKPALPQAVRPSVPQLPGAFELTCRQLPAARTSPDQPRDSDSTSSRRCCAAPLPEACQASGRLAAERAGPASSGGRGQGARDGPARRARARARCDRAGVRQSRPGCRAPADCTPRCVVSALPPASQKVVSRRSSTPGDAPGGCSRLPGPGAFLRGARTCVHSPGLRLGSSGSSSHGPSVCKT